MCLYVMGGGIHCSMESCNLKIVISCMTIFSIIIIRSAWGLPYISTIATPYDSIFYSANTSKIHSFMHKYYIKLAT